VIHSVAGAALVVFGGYAPFERLIKVFIALMFTTLVGCALFIAPPSQTIGAAITRAGVPSGGIAYVMAVIGGDGGSVTLLSYGYWIREKRWEGVRWMRMVRVDLTVAYALTGVFGVAVVLLAAHVLHGSGEVVQGKGAVLTMASMLEPVLGQVGRFVFLVGFWGAVATSLLGTWQGVPYLFCDFMAAMRRLDEGERRSVVRPSSVWYRFWLGFLAFPPLILLLFERPVTLIVVYSVLGALFMPFLAATLLYMNSRAAWVGRELTNRWTHVIALVLCLVLFGVLAWTELAQALSPVG
jgi:Mn2+/Fe2+ NRAMP family transporter